MGFSDFIFKNKSTEMYRPAGPAACGLYGLAVGDALGVPVEGLERRALERYPVKEMLGQGTHRQPAGTWSDDTAMTLCVLDSLACKKGTVNCNDIMTNFLHWASRGTYAIDGKVFDVGENCCAAISRYASGCDALSSGFGDELHNSNGSLMRALPISFLPLSEREMVNTAALVSSLTHGHEVATAACAAYTMIAKSLYDGCKNADFAVHYGFNAARFVLNGLPRELLRAENAKNLDAKDVRMGNYVVDTLETAIMCLLNTSSYEEAVLVAINFGGDADTVAAITGGLAGLLYREIPMRFVDSLRGKELLDATLLRFQGAVPPSKSVARDVLEA